MFATNDARAPAIKLSSSKNAALLPITFDSTIEFLSLAAFDSLRLNSVLYFVFHSHARITEHVQFHFFFSFVFKLWRFDMVHRFVTTELIQFKSIWWTDIVLLPTQTNVFSLLPNSIPNCPFTETRILRYNWYFNSKQSIHTWPKSIECHTIITCLSMVCNLFIDRQY